MNIKSAKNLVGQALSEVKTISPDQAFKKLELNQCNLIDIRDIRELENEGKVAKSFHIPRGMLEFWIDPESSYFKQKNLDIDKEIILFCAAGLRSALAAKTLNEMGTLDPKSDRTPIEKAISVADGIAQPTIVSFEFKFINM